MQESIVQCAAALGHSRRILLTTHLNPDGDALGSEVALASFLAAQGKEVSIINCSELPPQYRFLHNLFPIRTYEPPRDQTVLQAADLIVVLDANASHRLGSMEQDVLRSSAMKICIDHHPDAEQFADLYCVDEGSTATGEIIYKLLVHIDATQITRPVAEGLYAAIMTDTGSFRFPKTDSETHEIVADLLARGADPVYLYQKIFEEGPVSRLHLLGEALRSITLSAGGAVASMTIPRSAFRETGTGEADTEDMINHLLTIGGVRIALLFVELESGVKVSFRSKGTIPANFLARDFGGNGHRNAAGARLPGAKLGEVVENVTRRAATYVES